MPTQLLIDAAKHFDPAASCLAAMVDLQRHVAICL